MEIIAPKKKNVIMDATLLSSLMSCGRYVDLRFNHQFISNKGKSNSLETGSLVHKVLEVYYKHRIQNFSRTQAIGAGISAGQLYITGCPYCSQVDNLTPQCGHEPLEYPGVQETPEKNEGNKTGWSWVLQTCEQYFEFYKNDSWIPLFVETVRGKVLYEDDDIRVLWKAKLDLGVDTNQGIYSVDHKTMKQKRDQSTLNNQFTGQCLVMGTRNVIINKIGFQTTLEPKDRFVREMVSYSAERLLEWQSEILPYYAYKLLEYTENNHWPPNFTHCENKFGFCMFRKVCEQNPDKRQDVLTKEFLIGPKWDPVNAKLEE